MPLFQLAVVGLEARNFGKTLAYKTIKWSTAKGTTSVKFSPSSEHVLVGYGVRTGAERAGQSLVVAMFRPDPRQSIKMVQGVKSSEDDLNIALFHPSVGFIYGTKRGCIRCVDMERRTNVRIPQPGPYSLTSVQHSEDSTFRLTGSSICGESDDDLIGARCTSHTSIIINLLVALAHSMGFSHGAAVFSVRS